jgi:Spy/CpxP family protein refolding chaperone
VAKKNQDQDIQSRLRQLTEQTRRTRRELEDLIKRPNGDRLRAFVHDRPESFRRRRQRPEDK